MAMFGHVHYPAAFIPGLECQAFSKYMDGWTDGWVHCRIVYAVASLWNCWCKPYSWISAHWWT